MSLKYHEEHKKRVEAENEREESLEKYERQREMLRDTERLLIET